MPGQVNLNQMFDELKGGVVTLAEVSLKKFKNEAQTDALQFIENSKEKLSRWTLLLANGDLNTEEFEWLVNSQKHLLEMQALKQTGLAAIRVDQFKNSVLNLVVDTVFSFIKI